MTDQRRLRDLDWYRGLAVVFMIEVHSYDAWLRPDRRDESGPWFWIQHLGGYAAPMFLFIAGLTLAARVVPAMARGGDPAPMRAQAARRGAEVILWGYLFRLALVVLAGNPWRGFFKVDILQQIGLSLAACSPCVGRRPALRAALGFLAICVLMPPITALPVPPAPWRQITAFVTGERPLAYFPALPWMAYTFGGFWMGAVLGDLRGERVPARLGALFVAGVALAYLSRQVINPRVSPHFADPNHGLDGVTRMTYRLGVCLAVPAVARLAARALGARWDPISQMGRTSLLIYAVHVPIVYGPYTRIWRHKLGLVEATGAVIVLIAAMVLLSIARTSWWPAWRKRRAKAAPTEPRLRATGS